MILRRPTAILKRPAARRTKSKSGREEQESSEAESCESWADIPCRADDFLVVLKKMGVEDSEIWLNALARKRLLGYSIALGIGTASAGNTENPPTKKQIVRDIMVLVRWRSL